MAEGKNSTMKVGDIVEVKDHVDLNVHKFLSKTVFPQKGARVGLIIDCQEMADGFYEFEVIFEGWSSWFRDLELKMIDVPAQEADESW